MDIEFGSMGQVARVTAVGDGGALVCFDLRNGNSGSFTVSGHMEQGFAVGEVLLLISNDEGKRVERMPSDVWPEELWVGVVKIKEPDVTIIDTAGRWRTVDTTDAVEYEVGNTVHATATTGVVRVLSKSPIRLLDAPELDEAEIDKFRHSPKDDTQPAFEDFGGLVEVVDRARELIEVPLRKHKALSDIGARPIKGILFTGEPGTGKTMLARIIASQAGAAFFEISGPEIFSKWYGQSEEVLRRLFEAAAKAKEERAIIFFDEIDSVAAQRDDVSHEASKRVVAQLLTLMDGFSADANVVVIAATNRPQDLDLALRRPGRFDWEIEFPHPNELDREDILRKTAQPLRTDGALPHESIAKRSHGWSGADLAAIWSEAALLAVKDNRLTIRQEDYIGGFERVARAREQAARTGAGEQQR